MRFGTTILLATAGLIFTASGAGAQLITVNFNTEAGAQSLVNAGSANVTSSFTSNATYSSSFAPSNTAGFSGTFGANGNSKVTVAGAGPALSNLQSFTLTAWVNPSSYATSGSRIFYSSSSGGSMQFILGASNMTIGVDNINVNASIVPTLNTWTFVAATYDGTQTSNNLSVYTGDGTSLSAATVLTLNAGTTLGTYTDLFIGSINASDTARNFRGLLDNARVYGATTGNGGVLSSAQLTSVMQINDAIPEPSTWALFGASLVAFAALRRRRASIQ